MTKLIWKIKFLGLVRSGQVWSFNFEKVDLSLEKILLRKASSCTKINNTTMRKKFNLVKLNYM